jgi:hypothetical protein
MIYQFQLFLSRFANWLRQSKDIKREWSRYYFFLKQIPEIRSEPNSDAVKVILRLDDIGDYFLYSNALRCLLDAEEEQNTNWVLIGNGAWKSLLEEDFKNYKITCFWLNKDQWFSNENYRIEFLESLSKLNVYKLLFPSYTRVLLLEGVFRKLWPNCSCVAWKAKDSPYSEELNKNIETLVFTTNYWHETQLNHYFSERVIGRELPIKVELEYPVAPAYLEKEYFAICVGGKQKSKQWPEDRFAFVAQKIMEQNNSLQLVILGVASESILAERIAQDLPKERVHNLCGKTTLNQTPAVLKGAKFVLSNVTSMAHLSALQNVPTLIPFNGNRMGRFFPYPKTLPNCHLVNPKAFRFDPISHYDWEEKWPIKAVSKAQVWEAVQTHFSGFIKA